MTQQVILAAPLLIPLATAGLCTVLAPYRRLQAAVSLLGCIIFWLSTLRVLCDVSQGQILVAQFGNWSAPFGIVFVADRLAAVMLAIAGVMAIAIALYQLGNLGLGPRSSRWFAPLFHGLLFGVTGAFLTGDLFNLYVWFEVLLIASFGLLVIQGTRLQVDAGIKYAVLNLLATSMLLMAVGFLYGLTGTLNMADLSRSIAATDHKGLASALSLVFLVTFAAKAAAFPLFFWLPASYPVASIPVVALFAALLTKVGVYALLRCSTLLFTGHDLPIDIGHALVIAMALIAPLTMITGVLGAAAQFDTRRILTFHSISQVGYILSSIFIATPLAYAGAVYFVVHHSLVKSSLFLLAGIMREASGSFHVKKSGGLFRAEPLIAVLFFLQAMSLAGLPPLSGFWAKFLLLRATAEAGQYWLLAIGLVVSVLTLYSMLKIWNEAFWKAAPNAASDVPGAKSRWRTASVAQRSVMLAGVGLLVFATLAIGIVAEPMVRYAIATGDQLADRQAYVEAVLAPRPAPNVERNSFRYLPDTPPTRRSSGFSQWFFRGFSCYPPAEEVVRLSAQCFAGFCMPPSQREGGMILQENGHNQ